MVSLFPFDSQTSVAQIVRTIFEGEGLTTLCIRQVERFDARTVSARFISFKAQYSIMDEAQMDANLMVFVNILGVITFSSIVLYHVITANPKDVEA